MPSTRLIFVSAVTLVGGAVCTASAATLPPLQTRQPPTYTGVKPSISLTGIRSACDALAGNSTHTALTFGYVAQLATYSSYELTKAKPKCFMEPSSAVEMSYIFQALSKTREPFAIKSGGHAWNAGLSSSTGVTISTKNLNQLKYDAASQTVIVGPGLKWIDVIGYLEPFGVTVIGGRVPTVAPGGFLLGGGLSLKSPEYGWAVNSVLGFEAVLADGTIVKANDQTNPDLYFVLKGGLNQFAAVTQFTLRTHPQKMVWGGTITFTKDKTPQVLQAIRDFTEFHPDDATVLVEHLRVQKPIKLFLKYEWLIVVYYNGANPPAHYFKNFTDIGPETNNCETRLYSTMITEQAPNIGPIATPKFRQTAEFIPLPKTSDFMLQMYNNFDALVPKMLNNGAVIVVWIAQPVPSSIAKHALARGGDLLDLNPNFDYIEISCVAIWVGDKDEDEVMQRSIENVTDTARSVYLDAVKAGTAPGPEQGLTHIPVFANHANLAQDYFGRLSEQAKAKAFAAQDKFDPERLFAELTSGYKMKR